MTSFRQNSDFAAHIIGVLLPNGLLDDAIEWISKTLSPEDVFDTKDLEAWAEGSGFVKAEEET